MKISFNWLKTYVETNLSAEEVGAILTATGLEVESIEKIETIKGGLNGVVIGEVLAKEKHPDADRLSITQVNVGGEVPLQIVCGAPNVAVGQKVLVATVGTTIFPKPEEPLKIKRSKIRGIESNGMICAEDELGLGASHDGIMVLPAQTKVGTLAKDYFSIESDFIFEVGLTPNRADAMGHIGVARDLTAFLNFHKRSAIELILPETNSYSPTNTSLLSVKIDSKSCTRYSGAVIKNVRVGESPSWLQNKLRAIGLKPINTVVDITNYVMFESGNPLHAFDLNQVGNEIIIRNARENEQITTLDGVLRNMSENDLLICNAVKPMCIAGIFGGLDSGIKDSTTDVFLEVAHFSPTAIRKTSKIQGINTDSSFRFERGVDPNNIDFAKNRAISLILEIAGGELTQIIDLYPTPIMPQRVEFNYDNCRRLCGTSFTNEEISVILKALDIDVISSADNVALLSIPTYRVDVKREADVIEEVLRIYGFDSVPIPLKLNASISTRHKPDSDRLYNLTADLLVNSGFYEIMNNSLSSSTIWSHFKSATFKESEDVKILNPLSNELDVLRQTLIFGGLAAIEFNQNRQKPDLKLFEFGKVYNKSENAYNEIRKLGIFISGDSSNENWTANHKPSNFYHIKSIVEKILIRLGMDNKTTSNDLSNDLFEDGYSIMVSNRNVADIGWINSSVLKASGIKNPVFYAELNWDSLIELSTKVKTIFKAVPKTQFVRRDFSLLLNESIKFSEIKTVAFETEKNLLKKVGLFDVYEGKNLAPGKKSYAVSFLFQDDEKTLKDNQVEDIMNEIKLKLQQNLGAELR